MGARLDKEVLFKSHSFVISGIMESFQIWQCESLQGFFAAEQIFLKKNKKKTFEFVSWLNSDMSVTLFCVNTLKEQRTAARKAVYEDDRRKEGYQSYLTSLPSLMPGSALDMKENRVLEMLFF